MWCQPWESGQDEMARGPPPASPSVGDRGLEREDRLRCFRWLFQIRVGIFSVQLSV